jgi:hypothetical protein
LKGEKIMKRNSIVKAFLLSAAGLMLTLIPFSTGSSNAGSTTLAAVQRGNPPPVPSVNGMWDFSHNMFAGQIIFTQPPGSFGFTGSIDICGFECTPFTEVPTDISGSLMRLTEFSPTTISFRRSRPGLVEDFTGTLIFRSNRAVGMFGTFKQLEPPVVGTFPWYAVRN